MAAGQTSPGWPPRCDETWHDGRVTDADQTELGDVQRTLFFPLLARARETARRRPLLRDPKAVELVAAIDFDPATYDQSFLSFAVLIRTLILDWWVSQFLAAHPAGTVVELGTGLNTGSTWTCRTPSSCAAGSSRTQHVGG
jgi:O-methyltransferase involved in polyketide biosynthesis